MKGDQAMELRRIMLIKMLEEVGADKDIPDQILDDLSLDELERLAAKHEIYQVL